MEAAPEVVDSLPTWALHLRDRVDLRINVRIRLRLVLVVVPVNPYFTEDLLYSFLRF